MFHEDEKYVRTKTRRVLRKILNSKDSLDIKLSNDDLGGCNEPKDSKWYIQPGWKGEPSAQNRQRLERAMQIRENLRHELPQYGLLIRMQQQGLWVICSLDAGLLTQYDKRDKRICAIIQRQIKILREAIEKNIQLVNPEDFLKIVERSQQLLAVAEVSEPNKRLRRNMLRLSRKIPDYYV